MKPIALRWLTVWLCMIAVSVLIQASVQTASAHSEQLIDGASGVSIVVGWRTEPPLQNELNEIEAIFRNVSDGNPVSNAVRQLNVFVERGQLSEPLDLVPVEIPGTYSAKIIPTYTGEYTVVMRGQVAGANVDARFEIEQVESVCGLQFPKDPRCGVVEEPPIYPFDEFFDRIEAIEKNLVSLNQTLVAMNESSRERISELTERIDDISRSAYTLGAIGVVSGIAGLALGLVVLARGSKTRT